MGEAFQPMLPNATRSPNPTAMPHSKCSTICNKPEDGETLLHLGHNYGLAEPAQARQTHAAPID